MGTVPQESKEGVVPMKRREFVKSAALSAAAVGLGGVARGADPAFVPATGPAPRLHPRHPRAVGEVAFDGPKKRYAAFSSINGPLADKPAFGANRCLPLETFPAGNLHYKHSGSEFRFD